MTKALFGLYAEYLTAILYFFKFHRILHHRYKTNVGEIDLIATKRKTIVFVEVKARKHGLHENIVSENQQKRIIRTAELFIAKHKEYQGYDLRIDLAVVRPFKLPQIIKNAW